MAIYGYIWLKPGCNPLSLMPDSSCRSRVSSQIAFWCNCSPLGSRQSSSWKKERPCKSMTLHPDFSPGQCCKAQLGITVTCPEDCSHMQQKAISPSAGRPPLQEITYIHAAIRSALESFAVEAHSMQGSAEITTKRLKALVDKHRFLRSVCTFHSASEDEILLPAARYTSRIYLRCSARQPQQPLF